MIGMRWSLSVPVLFLLLGFAEGRGISADAINMAEMPKATKGFQPGFVKAEVLLDRLHFSPGLIDGTGGENFRKALAAFQKSQQLQESGQLDQASWARLTDRTSPIGIPSSGWPRNFTWMKSC